MALAVVLIGPPSGGKGAQKEVLIKAGCIGVEVSERLTVLEKFSPEFREMKEALRDKGKLLPDEVINDVLKEYLDSKPRDADLVLCGGCRTRYQTEFIYRYLTAHSYQPVFILLDARREVCRQRMITRKKKAEEKQKLMEIIPRPDDSEEIWEDRYDTYRNNLLHVVRFLRTLPEEMFEIVDANGSIGDVANQVFTIVPHLNNERGKKERERQCV